MASSSSSSSSSSRTDIPSLHDLFDVTSDPIEALDPFKSLVVDAVTKGKYPKSVMIRIYPPAAQSRGVNESVLLDDVMSNCKEAVDHVVEPFDFKDKVRFQNQICSALVVAQGRSLGQLVKRIETDKVQSSVVPVMKSIAEALHFLHSQAELVHGDVRLENVINVAEDLPVLRLQGFEHSCRLRETLRMDRGLIDVEYCPPELAAQLVHHQTCSFPAAESYDVYCFGVLWLKYLRHGEDLLEFMDFKTDTLACLKQICQPKFSFTATLQRVTASQQMKNLICACLHQDPGQRPTFKQILRNCVIRGYTTTLMLLNSADHQKLYSAMLKNLQVMMSQINRMTIQLAQNTLPSLWVLLPWKQQKEKRQLCNLQLREAMELKLLCDAAFDNPHEPFGSNCSTCEEDDRIRIKKMILDKYLPVFHCSAAVLKIAKVAGRVMNLPIAKSLECQEFIDAALLVLKQEKIGDQTLLDILESVDAMEQAETASPIKHQQDQQAVVSVLQENSQAIRSWFQSVEKQQMVCEFLHELDREKDWTKQSVIGGLEKICDRSGNIRWVCPHHARSLGVLAGPNCSTQARP